MPEKPRQGETEAEFMQRCIPYLIREGKPSDQAKAICASMWREHGQRRAFRGKEEKKDGE